MVAILSIGYTVAIRLEQRTISSTAPEVFPLKYQGLAFQRAAAHAPEVLPLYGSSELIIPPVPEKAGKFFRTAPTGFQVSPVGNLGATTATILQKIGALGSDLRGKKVVISLSPGWFLASGTRWDWYKGNFSLLAASELIFGSSIDFQLKRDIALRMLECPSTLKRSPLLEFALSRLASGSQLDRLVFCALWPLGKIQNAILDLQDHFAALSYILRDTKPTPRRQIEMLNWPNLIAKATESTSADAAKFEKVPGAIRRWHDAGFVARINTAPEWIDFELLLRVLAQAHAQPLLLSMPMAGQYYDRIGVSRIARETYYKRMRTLAQRYRFSLVQFEDHDNDSAFLDNQENHLTKKGWIFYDRALDDFFHGRVPPM
jgi:Protein involved in D-alanine esterification of lipoteichoic acid and wall teichoic acid (D-alanine transfer protein)